MVNDQVKFRLSSFEMVTGVMVLSTLGLIQSPKSTEATFPGGVVAILQKNCSPCHYGSQSAGGLKLETVAQVLKGGVHGPAIVPGKASESRLVLMMEGKLLPAMPPIPNARPLNTKAIRAWIDAGAKTIDDRREAIQSSGPKPIVRRPSSIVSSINDQRLASVAFSPDGRLLAAGGFQVVYVFDAATGKRLIRLEGMPGPISAVQFSPDGTFLAAAGGIPGKSGQIRFWDTKSFRPTKIVTGHNDVIYGMAFSPDKQRMATAGYDRQVLLWTISKDGRSFTPRTLQDHIDSVFAVAFSPNGALLASAAADRTVKVWDIAKGKRVFTLSESTAELFAVAFSPDGKQIAAGGVDKALRTWNVSPTGGKLAKTAFAHNGAILRIAYSKDGRSIYTSGEDGLVKRFAADTLAEEKVYAKQPDWPHGIALSPNDKLVAVGRHDGSLTIYDAGTGKALYELIKSKIVGTINTAEPPTTSTIPGRRLGDSKQRRPPNKGPVTLVAASLGSLSPNGVVRGGATRFTLFGGEISDANAVFFDDLAISGKIVTPADTNKGVLRVDTTIAANTRIGIHRVYAQTPHGTTGAVTFAVGGWPEVAQKEPNDAPSAAQSIIPPCTIVGAIDQAGDLDCYRVDARAGEELVFEVVAQPIRSRLQPVLTLLDSTGKTIAESQQRVGKADALLGYRFKEAGAYVLQIKDYEGVGGGDVHYRLNVGEFPVVTRVFPLGVQKGTTAEVSIEGFNLGGMKTAKVTAPPNASWGKTFDAQVQTPKGTLVYPIRLAVGSDTEVTQQPGNLSLGKAQAVPVPATVNGVVTSKIDQISSPAALNRYPAHKGRQLVLDFMARRMGSPLDSEIEVLDAKGKPVEQAVLRTVGKTDITFADRDSASSGLRITAWDDFHPNDYIRVGREVIKILRLPNGPDEDVFFRSLRGQRLGYLGTTPEFHTIGAAVYKVEIHPPGTALSPNGYPITHVYAQNDDGGPYYGKDSYLLFTPPADGDYVVRLTDARGQSGEDYTYRLQIHEPRPDYKLSMSPEHPNIPKGGRTIVEVNCERYEGFDGEVEVKLEGLPTGFTATTTTVQSGESSATILISAAPGISTPPVQTPSTIKLVGRSAFAGKQIVHTIEPDNGVRLVTVLPESDVKLTTNVREIVIHPGEEVDVDTVVERQGQFGNRVPIEVKNLPFGVKVQNIGLNAILVTEEESSRKYTLYCEPWVKPLVRTFYTVANVEGGVANAAEALVIRVEPNRISNDNRIKPAGYTSSVPPALK